jgi:hypothetical protein
MSTNPTLTRTQTLHSHWGLVTNADSSPRHQDRGQGGWDIHGGNRMKGGRGAGSSPERKEHFSELDTVLYGR